MEMLGRGILQRNESGVVCDMMGQGWIRHWKKGCLVEIVWFWMCGTTIVHMLYMLYMLHLWCCAHALLCIYSVCTCLCNVVYRVVEIVLCVYYICSVGYRWCYVHVGYLVLCTYRIVRMLDTRSCVHMVLCTCWIWDVVFIWCYVHIVYVVLCTYGVVCMTLHVALCARGTGYMLYMWCCVQVVLCACGTVYMWCRVHAAHVALCTCGAVYTLYRWCGVHMAPCTRCACGVMYMWCCVGGVVYRWYCVHVVHMVLVYMWYCVHDIHAVLRACGTMYVHCVVMVLWHVYSLFFTMCIVLYTKCRCMYCSLVHWV